MKQSKKKELLRSHVRPSLKRLAPRIVDALSRRLGTIEEAAFTSFEENWNHYLELERAARSFAEDSSTESALRTQIRTHVDLYSDTHPEALLDIRAEIATRLCLHLRVAMDVLAESGKLASERGLLWEVINANESNDDLRIEALECLAKSPSNPQKLKLIVEKHPPLVARAALIALFSADPALATQTSSSLFDEIREGDHFLVRAKACSLLSEYHSVADLPLALDPSEHVRQEWIRSLGREDSSSAHERLLSIARQDTSPRVRGLALLHLAKVQSGALGISEALDHPSPLVRRCAIRAAEDWFHHHGTKEKDASLLQSSLTTLVHGAQPKEALEAALTLRVITAEEDPEVVRFVQTLRETLKTVKTGGKVQIICDDELRFARALRVVARDDLTLSARVRKGIMDVYRGEPRRFSWWRTFFEIRHLRPDKRQDVSHTQTRVAPGDLVCPAPSLLEVTATKVPGEPRFANASGSWGPYLPRVDDFLAALHRPRTIISAAGRVRIQPPPVRKRLRVWWTLTKRYDHFAAMRERSLEARETRRRSLFIQTLRELGFELDYDPEPEQLAGTPIRYHLATVDQCFQSHLAALPVAGEIIRYFGEQGGGKTSHLLIFLVAMFAFVLARATLIYRRIHRSVDSIPFTLGGWGTRGKSGTERLKAGMFQGFGFDVLVKTTGCEAMTIRQTPGRSGVEVFLYRPYGKASIWEQARVLHMAANMNVHVFLWECMALRPRYVEILAHHWMRGRLATITNAYPDHEDVHGPTGYDVAEVMARFMPEGGHCITAEFEMLPVLREAAGRKGTSLDAIDPLDADLLPQDLLSRFPYAEHPRNISLVARLAEHLGLDPERAIVEMADHVVPDLGVLKTYGPVAVEHRELRFSNGMSANERAGCLSNWRRLGLDQHEGFAERIITVVNNRGDRIPRSRVFADILVKDIGASTHILIGTNLGGLKQFIEEALDEWLTEQEIMLPGEDASDDSHGEGRKQTLHRFDEVLRQRLGINTSPHALAEDISRFLDIVPNLSDQAIFDVLQHIPHDPRQADLEELGVTLREQIIQAGLDADQAEEIEEWSKQLGQTYAEVANIHELLERAPREESNKAFREFYRRHFLRSIRVVEDAKASGNEVIQHLLRAVPPGHRAHCIGLQNIKGTGLDFVYRWLELDEIQNLVKRLNHETEGPLARAELRTREIRGVLGLAYAIAYLEEHHNEDESLSEILDLLRERFSSVMEKPSTSDKKGGSKTARMDATHARTLSRSSRCYYAQRTSQ